MPHDFEEKLAEQAFKQLTPEQLEKVASRVKALVAELEDNPALLKEAAEKIGFNWEAFAERLGTTALMGAGGMAGAASVNFLINKAHDLQKSLGKAKAYKSMLDNNPQLSEEGVDAQAVQKHFDTLYRFNPEYAEDPMVAGTYVQNAVEMSRPSLDTVNNLVNARKNMLESRGRGIDIKPLGTFARHMEGVAQEISKEQMPKGPTYEPH